MAADNRRMSDKRTKQWLNILIGGSDVALEARLFNSFCLIVIALMLFNIPFNYFSGLKVTALLFTVFVVIVAFAYYLGRFRQDLAKGAVIITANTAVVTLFTVNYFFSAGARGASGLSLLLTFMLAILISPRRLYGLWLAVFLTVMAGLLWIEYQFPETVVVTYENTAAELIDQAVAYTTGILVCFFCLVFVKEAYNREKRSADQKSIELARLNDEKLRLFSIISHDLQAPLSSLHSYVRLIGSDRLSEEERRQLESGLANSLHGSQEMLSNMLVWSQSQLSGFNLSLIRHNIMQVLKPVVDIQRIYANQKAIKLESDMDNSLYASVDRDMLQLIVRNLIANAIKFTLRDGRICVKVLQQGDDVEIIVEDNGIGIDEERQKDLFTLKTQATYGTNNERGIGLGLFLCKEYAEAFGGTLTFVSEVGTGTTFFLRIPLVN